MNERSRPLEPRRFGVTTAANRAFAGIDFEGKPAARAERTFDEGHGLPAAATQRMHLGHASTAGDAEWRKKEIEAAFQEKRRPCLRACPCAPDCNTQFPHPVHWPNSRGRPR